MMFLIIPGNEDKHNIHICGIQSLTDSEINIYIRFFTTSRSDMVTLSVGYPVSQNSLQMVSAEKELKLQNRNKTPQHFCKRVLSLRMSVFISFHMTAAGFVYSFYFPAAKE